MLIALTGACVCAPAWALDAAGRVLVAAGEVTVVRGAERIAAQRGTEVRVGDTIQVGAKSNTQIRLTDESIVSLRPDTTFRLSEYVFDAKQPNTQRSVSELVAGGMRTVTGLIARLSPEKYAIRTETATIGVRGTHFSLVECNNSCRNPNGTLAPNGTYGGVTDGRISVVNQSGEHVFGADQYFQVSGTAAAPQRLIAPPAFLRDTLEGRARNQRPAASQQAGSQGQATQEKSREAAAGSSAGGMLAQTGSGAGTGDSGLAASVTATTTSTVLATNVFQSTTDAAIAGPAAILQPTNTGTVFYRVQGPFNIPTSCSAPPCGVVVAGEFTLAVNLSLQRAGLSANFQLDNGERYSLGTPSAVSGTAITVGGGQASFNSTFNRADFPQNQGAFRCLNCGAVPGADYVQSFTVSGTISGSTANVTLTGIDTGGAASFPLTLTQQTPPSTAVAAISAPRLGGGTDSRSFAYWDVNVDPAGKLLGYGSTAGAPSGAVGTATNTIVGSSPATGNLVWGYWSGSGATITDSNFATVSASGTEPWITGIAPNALPPSLGSSVTYTPIGSFMAGTGVLNSASLTADFVGRTLALGINATNPGAGNTFQLNAVTGFSTLSGRFSAGFNSVTCSGTCAGSSPSGSFGGFFAGPNAEGAGTTFSAGFGVGGGGVTGVVAFKR